MRFHPNIYAILLLLLLLPTAPASAEAPGVTPSVDELQRLVETLHDEKGRAHLISQLQALIAAQRGADAQHEAASPMSWLSQRIDQVIGEILAGAAVLVDAPRVVAWGRSQLEDETARRRWLDIGLALVIVFGCAVAATMAACKTPTAAMTHITSDPPGATIEKVAQTGKPTIVNDTARDPRFARRFDTKTQFQTRSILCAPIVNKSADTTSDAGSAVVRKTKPKPSASASASPGPSPAAQPAHELGKQSVELTIPVPPGLVPGSPPSTASGNAAPTILGMSAMRKPQVPGVIPRIAPKNNSPIASLGRRPLE